MTRQRIVYLLALIGSLIFYLAYQEWLAWVVLLTVVFFPWLSLLLSIKAMKHLEMKLVVASTIPIGQEERVNLSVTSKLPMPPYKSKIRITKPLTGETWTLKPGAKLPAEHCGCLHIQLDKPGSFDYLGLFRLKVKNPAGQTVLVLPEIVETELPTNLMKCPEPRWRRKPGGGYAENYEIRQYQPGDHLNQIHWKLSAKMGELMLREPMEPEQGQMLLTMDLKGTAAELDRKLGQLLWLSQWFLKHEIPFDLQVLTANGIDSWTIQNSEAMDQCIASLLDTPVAREGSVRELFFQTAWRYHIGGEQDEA